GKLRLKLSAKLLILLMLLNFSSFPLQKISSLARAMQQHRFIHGIQLKNSDLQNFLIIFLDTVVKPRDDTERA
ncbi:MAG TPA: palindromic element RPE4 domain-containing protein, partial [Rickettsia endosymbiont of Pyrocoelia pectoralis]|nr:palindromic element RPE4 domain-containing protein [Rickettsia endosymbiont of Pyrocoelia pectoralis]